MVEIQPEVIDIASLGESPVITLSKSDSGGGGGFHEEPPG